MAGAETPRRGAVIFDRDGVLNEDAGYVYRPEDLRWVSGAMAAVRRFNDLGWWVFVVTNQSGVARGLYPEERVHALHRWMSARLAETAGARIDAFEHCPHHPEALLPAFRRDCRRRKPAPGMIEDLLRAWPVERAGSFLVGDKPSDLAAAEAAGLPGRLFPGGNLAAFLDEVLA